MAEDVAVRERRTCSAAAAARVGGGGALAHALACVRAGAHHRTTDPQSLQAFRFQQPQPQQQHYAQQQQQQQQYPPNHQQQQQQHYQQQYPPNHHQQQQHYQQQYPPSYHHHQQQQQQENGFAARRPSSAGGPFGARLAPGAAQHALQPRPPPQQAPEWRTKKPDAGAHAPQAHTQQVNAAAVWSGGPA